MKIRKLVTYTSPPWLSLVRVQTDEGEEGWGQIAPANADISAVVFHRQVAPLAVGAEVADHEALVDHIVEANYKFPGTYVRRALAGLDSALWDLRGKLEDRSVCELWGGRPGPVGVYASSMSRKITPEDEVARMTRLRGAHGFRAVKVKIGKRRGRDEDEWPGRTEALVKALREAFGDELAILVDANSCYTPAKAIEVGRMLEGYGVCHFEEPCPYWEYEWTAEVAAALDVPVAGGEQDCFLVNWRRMIDMRAVDIVQPDLCYVGGPTRARRVAAMAHEAGLACTPHSANVSMLLVFTLHLLRAIPNAGPYVEYGIERRPWTIPPYAPIPEAVDGVCEVPPGPGWGVEPNPDWLAAAERKATEAA